MLLAIIFFFNVFYLSSGSRCPPGGCMPSAWHCNSIERFCVFCDRTETMQTLHDSIGDLRGFTFYISPIQFDCKGLRDGAFLQVAQLNLNISGMTPVNWVDSSLVITKPGLILRSLFPSIQVQFPLNTYSTPVLIVMAEDCVISDLIGISLNSSANNWGVPLILNYANNLTIRNTRSPLLLQVIVASHLIVNISQSSGDVLLISPTRTGTGEIVADSNHTIFSCLPSEFIFITAPSSAKLIHIDGAVFSSIDVDCLRECDQSRGYFSSISYILMGVALFAIIVCLIHFCFSSHLIHDKKE